MSSLIFRDIELKRQRNARQFEASKERWLAKLVRFEGNLRVPNRPGYVYAQQLPEDDAPPPVPVLCVGVQARENLRVWIERNYEGDWEVVGFWRGITQQDDYDLQPYLPLHASDHEWPDRKPHVDAVNVYQRAIVPLRSSPGSSSSLLVRVEPYRYIYDGALVLFSGDASVDLSGSQPAAGLARFVGVYLDPATNTIGTVDGDTTIDAGPVTPDSPTFPAGVITSSMVRLDGGQSAFSESDFVDLRIFLGRADIDAEWKLGNLIVLSTSGDGDYSTVATAFAAAGAGDTILVDEGSYTCDGETTPDEVAVIGIDPVNCEFTSNASDVTLYLGSGNHVANLKITNSYGAAAGYCIEVPNTSADLPTIRNLNLLQNGHADGFCVYVDEDANIDTCRMFSLNGGGIEMTAGGTAYVFGGRIEADAASNAIDNSAAGAVYLFGDPFLINGITGSVDGQYVDETGLVHNLTGLDMEGVTDALILSADGNDTISAPANGQIDVEVAGADQIHVSDGKLWPHTDNDIDLGDGTHEYKDAYFDGVIYADTVDLEGNADALVLSADGNDTISAPTNGQIDFEVGAADEAHLTAYGLAAMNHAFRVTNSSGGAVVAGDLGYIDSAGEYVETTTAYDDVAWCVVVKGGANSADIYVARRGQVTVTLDGNCSAGDYLYTSTTAGQATTETYVRPEVCGVALTANAGGAGGTCEALLLTDTIGVPLALADSVYQIHATDGGSDSDWNGTIDSLPGGAAVRYDNVSGDERNLRPNATTLYGKLRLYNSTRAEYALISDNDPTGGAGYDGEITLTAAVPGTWAATDAITIRSQTNTSVIGAAYFLDLELTGTDIPTLTRILEMEWKVKDTGAGNEKSKIHPWETNDNAKRISNQGQVTNQEVPMSGIKVKLIQDRFCILWSGSGAGTARFELKPVVAHVAAP